MATSSQPLLARSREICWRQWTALGVSGVKEPESQSVIDLEALILFVGSLGDTDPRLRDEATDWCAQFGARFVSASRLRNLLAAEPKDGRAQVLEFLATVNAHSNTRWPVPASIKPRHVELSGKSRLPDPRKRPELLRLQLRALFGTTARAEILLSFVASRPSPEPFLSASDLVTTGYSKRNVALVLADLAIAGLLTERKAGNQLRYRLERRAELTKLAPAAQSAGLDRWDARFRAITAARRFIIHVEKRSPALAGLDALRFVDELSSTWSALGLSPPNPEEPAAYADELTAWLDRSLIPSEPR